MIHSLSVNNDKVNAKIKISLKKPESGGVRYFSVTGTFWKPGQVRIDRNMIASGAALHSIKEQFPELAIFADLHLRDHKGAPSSAVENGIYFAKPESGCDGAGPEKLAQFFDITIDKASLLLKLTDMESENPLFVMGLSVTDRLSLSNKHPTTLMYFPYPLQILGFSNGISINFDI